MGGYFAGLLNARGARAAPRLRRAEASERSGLGCGAVTVLGPGGLPGRRGRPAARATSPGRTPGQCGSCFNGTAAMSGVAAALARRLRGRRGHPAAAQLVREPARPGRVRHARRRRQHRRLDAARVPRGGRRAPARPLPAVRGHRLHRPDQPVCGKPRRHRRGRSRALETTKRRRRSYRCQKQRSRSTAASSSTSSSAPTTARWWSSRPAAGSARTTAACTSWPTPWPRAASGYCCGTGPTAAGPTSSCTGGPSRTCARETLGMLVKKLGIEQVVAAGGSGGARDSIVFTMMWPELVDKLAVWPIVGGDVQHHVAGRGVRHERDPARSRRRASRASSR